MLAIWHTVSLPRAARTSAQMASSLASSRPITESIPWGCRGVGTHAMAHAFQLLHGSHQETRSNVACTEPLAHTWPILAASAIASARTLTTRIASSNDCGEPRGSLGWSEADH